MPDASRRAVLAAGGIGAAALVAAPSLALPLASVPPRTSFDAVRGTAVQLRGPAGRVRAVVAEVGDLVGARAGDLDRYSVLLKPSTRLPDGIYTISSRSGRPPCSSPTWTVGKPATEAVVHAGA